MLSNQKITRRVLVDGGLCYSFHVPLFCLWWDQGLFAAHIAWVLTSWIFMAQVMLALRQHFMPKLNFIKLVSDSTAKSLNFWCLKKNRFGLPCPWNMASHFHLSMNVTWNMLLVCCIIHWFTRKHICKLGNGPQCWVITAETQHQFHHCFSLPSRNVF